MKKNLIMISSVLAVVIIMCMICVFSRNLWVNDTDGTSAPQNLINVQGTSSVIAVPTVAYVDIGVTTFSENAADAQRNNAEKMTRVYEALDRLGIEKDKIKTVNYTISPRYDYTYYKSTMTGYDVSNRIMITVEDISKVSAVLDMTVEQGVNDANSVTFGITDDEKSKLYNQALAQAVESAKAKAVTIGTAAGGTVSGPISITEGTPVYSINYGYNTAEIAKDQASTPVSGGELTVEASVTLVYGYNGRD